LHQMAEETPLFARMAPRLNEAAANISDPDPTAVPWRRIMIADGVELLITDHQYTQHRDKIDWLVQWAGHVLE